MRQLGKELCVGVLLAAGLLGAAPTVTVTGVTQDVASRLVTVSYEVSEAAIVTVAVSSGGRTLAAPRAWGDVNAAVSDGAHTFCWSPTGVEAASAASVDFAVSAWDLADPPDYLVCDLDLGTVAYYVTTNDVPEGVGSDLYRTSKLLLRRIPAAGQTFSCLGKYPMQLSKDFWLGVFETTQEQYRRVMSAEPGAFTEATAWPMRPVTSGLEANFPQLFHKALRGDPTSATAVPDEPTSASFFGRLRCLFSSLPFDLPTEAQWDFAARAGSSSLLPSGVDSALAVGRFAANGGLPTGLTQVAAYLCGDTNGTARVGSYPPNAYGLYDMLGNVWEWCLDGYAADMGLSDAQTTQTDYVNRTIPSNQRVRRGGGWRDELGGLTYNGYRLYWDRGVDNTGFRCASGSITGTTRRPAQMDTKSLASLAGVATVVDTPVTPLERRIGTVALSSAIAFRSTPPAFLLIIR